jgi:hypothetical protein
MRVPCRPRPARAAIAGAACAAETRGEVSERRAWLSSPSVRSFCYPDTGTTTPAPMTSYRPETLQSELARRVFVFPDRVG